MCSFHGASTRLHRHGSSTSLSLLLLQMPLPHFLKVSPFPSDTAFDIASCPDSLAKSGPRSLSEDPVSVAQQPRLFPPAFTSRPGSKRVGPAPVPQAQSRRALSDKCLLLCPRAGQRTVYRPRRSRADIPATHRGTAASASPPRRSGAGRRRVRPDTWPAGPAPLRSAREPHLAYRP